MSKTFNKNIPYRFTGSLNSTATNYTIGSILISGGNVGINMFSPGTTSFNGDLHITARSTGGETPAILTLQPNSSIFARGQCQIRAISDATLGAGAGLTFSTRADNGANFDPTALISERMRISQSGNVGIGTTNPTVTLDVNGGILTGGLGSTISQQGLHLQWNRSNGGGEGWIINQQGSGNSGGIRFGRSDLSNNITEHMRITSSGNVGIGTTSPTNTLSVLGSGASGTIRVYSNTYRGETSIGFYENTTSGNIWVVGMGSWSSGTNLVLGSSGFGNPIMSLTTAGNVGIGTTNPTYTLDINSTGSPYSMLRVNGAALLQSSTGSVMSISPFNGSFGSIEAFTVGNTAKLPLCLNPYGGNVGIGTTNPTSRLYITDTSTSPFALIIDGTGKTVNNGININAATGYVPFINFQVNGNGPNIAATSTQLQITQSASNTTSINPNGGNVGINTTSPSTSLHVNGAITHGGGYAVFGLSVGTYGTGTTQMTFANTQFSSRITNNGNYFVFQDAGIFMIHVKLNSDSSVTSNMTLTCSYWNGSAWTTYQNSEESRTFNNQTDYSTHFMVQSSANQSWAIFFNNPTGANWLWSTSTTPDYWSRIMIYKVA